MDGLKGCKHKSNKRSWKDVLMDFVSLQVPFPVLQGEGVEYLGSADEAVIAISNYRLHIKFKDSVINVSLRPSKHAEKPQTV